MAKRELIERDKAILSLIQYQKGKKTLGQCIDSVPTVTEQEIVKPYLSALADNVNKLAKVGYDGKIYVPINDVFDLISNLLSE